MNTSQFNTCVDQWADGLYRFAFGIVHAKTQAQDVVQNSFLKLWENRHKVEPEKQKSYLFTIAYHEAISTLRKEHHSWDNDLPITAMVENGEWDNITELLWSALDALPEMWRSVIMLCDWEGYSYVEIAEIMSLSLPQVKITIYRARQSLKESLKNEYRA